MKLFPRISVKAVKIENSAKSSTKMKSCSTVTVIRDSKLRFRYHFHCQLNQPTQSIKPGPMLSVGKHLII